MVCWASRDGDDPDKLKLMLLNLSDQRAETEIKIAGFTASKAEYYEVTSTTPLDISWAGARDGGKTTLNGRKVDPSPGRVEASIRAIQPRTDTKISGRTVKHALPPYSITALVLTGSFER